MKHFLTALILLPLSIVIVLFAVANREPVTLSFDWFSDGAPLVAFTAPLWAVVFAAVAFGVILGGLASWLVQAKHRQAERDYRREARRLRAEVERARATSPALSLPAPATA